MPRHGTAHVYFLYFIIYPACTPIKSPASATVSNFILPCITLNDEIYLERKRVWENYCNKVLDAFEQFVYIGLKIYPHNFCSLKVSW